MKVGIQEEGNRIYALTWFLVFYVLSFFGDKNQIYPQIY